MGAFSKKYSEKRKHIRFMPPDPSSLKILTKYMGEEIEFVIFDVSLGGLGITVPRMPFSIINNSVISLKINYKELNFCIEARIVYSFKDPSNNNLTRYGLELLTPTSNDIKDLINSYCSSSLL